MWSGPPLEDGHAAFARAAAGSRQLIDLKAAPEAVGAEVRAFAGQQPEADRRGRLGQLFWLSLDWLNDERDVVIRGHQALRARAAGAGRQDRGRDARAGEAAAGVRRRDAGAVEQLQAARLWDTRIFTDRQKSLHAGLRPAGPARAARLRAGAHHPGTACHEPSLSCWRWAWPCWPPPAWAADTVADRVFGAGLLAGVTEPTVLRYRFEMSGKDIVPPFASHIDVDVREVAADGGKSVFVDMFEGAEPAAVRPDRGPGPEPPRARVPAARRDADGQPDRRGRRLFPAADPPRLQRARGGRALRGEARRPQAGRRRGW